MNARVHGAYDNACKYAITIKWADRHTCNIQQVGQHIGWSTTEGSPAAMLWLSRVQLFHLVTVHWGQVTLLPSGSQEAIAQSKEGVERERDGGQADSFTENSLSEALSPHNLAEFAQYHGVWQAPSFPFWRRLLGFRESMWFTQGHTATRVLGLRFKSALSVCVILNSLAFWVIRNYEHQIILVQLRVLLLKSIKTRPIIKDLSTRCSSEHNTIDMFWSIRFFDVMPSFTESIFLLKRMVLSWR